MEQNIKETLSEFSQQIGKDAQLEGLSEQELLNKWTSKLLSLSNEFRKEKSKQTFAELYNETILSFATKNGKSNLYEFVPTGFTDLDKLIGGLPLGELIILGARPGMGKTAFLVSLMANLAPLNIPIAYISVENSAQQIMLRLLSNFTELSFQDIVSKELNSFQINEIINKTKLLEKANIIIEDNCFSLDDIIAQVDYLAKEKGVKLVMIDYLQLIKVRSRKENNREADIAKISRELKGLARKYNIALFVNSQLSRAVENRPGGSKRPQLSDLRESGAIEQDADKVLFLYRPEYYGITEDEFGNNLNGIAQLLLSKNRAGGLSDVSLTFNPYCSSFKNVDPSIWKTDDLPTIHFNEIRKGEFDETNNNPF